MKTRNPKSRFDLKIGKHDNVVEIGGGHNPHPRANVVVDKFVESNYHRKTYIKKYKHQQFFPADGQNLPFEDKEFDFAISNQVLEHVDNPAQFLKEQMRVAKCGYIETPSLIGEYLFPKKAHKWLILEIDNKLILFEKEKYWFTTNMDFGYVFLTWMQKNSLAYKLLNQTQQNLFTVRYEWEGEIDFEINPVGSKYEKFFTGYWDAEMVEYFFPQKSIMTELAEVGSAFLSMCWNGMVQKLKKSARPSNLPYSFMKREYSLSKSTHARQANIFLTSRTKGEINSHSIISD